MTILKEEDFSLPTKDGKVIYGIITYATNPTDKIVILAHGLTGHIRAYIHMQARKFFAQNGYNVVRFSFYEAKDDARKLKDTTLKIHAEDLNIVCDHFRKSYKNLYCAGHSYGGTTLLLANPKANAFSFWDATFYPISMHWDHRKKLEGTPYYTLEYGITVLIGSEMYNEAYTLDTKLLANKIETPSHIILAGDNNENIPREGLYNTLTCEKSLDDIDGADHEFTVKNTLNDLLTKTLDWFNKY